MKIPENVIPFQAKATMRTGKIVCDVKGCFHVWTPQGPHTEKEFWNCPKCGAYSEFGVAKHPCPRCQTVCGWSRRGFKYICHCPCLLPQAAKNNLADAMAQRERREQKERAEQQRRAEEAFARSQHAQKASECWDKMEHACNIPEKEMPVFPHCHACPRFKNKRVKFARAAIAEETYEAGPQIPDFDEIPL